MSDANTDLLIKELEAIVSSRDYIATALQVLPVRQPHWDVAAYRVARERLTEAGMWLESHERNLARHLRSLGIHVNEDRIIEIDSAGRASEHVKGPIRDGGQ